MIRIKQYFFCLFFLKVLVIYSQTIEINYEQSFQNSSINLYKKYDLVLTDSLSIYIERESKSGNKNEGNVYNQKTYNLELGNKMNSNVYVNKRDGFYFLETFFGQALEIKEDVFKNNWQMIDSTKYIADYECKLATKEFRGRKFFAWYTNQIPTTFGPWKLNGLGGLILEARDSNSEFKLNALKIKSIDTSTDTLYNALINKINVLFENEKEILTIDKLKEFIDNKNQIILNRIKQQLPRGVSTPKLSSNCEECNDSLEKY